MPAPLSPAPGVTPAMARHRSPAKTPQWPPLYDRGKYDPIRMKSVADFLCPKMPGKFAPDDIKRHALEWRKERYLKTFAATLGNHSVSRFYAAWSSAEFRAVVEADPEFERAIADECEAIADRARYVLHESLGLVAPLEERKRPEWAGMAAALAALQRVAEDLRERSEFKASETGTDGKRGKPRGVAVPWANPAPVQPVS